MTEKRGSVRKIGARNYKRQKQKPLSERSVPQYAVSRNKKQKPPEKNKSRKTRAWKSGVQNNSLCLERWKVGVRINGGRKTILPEKPVSPEKKKELPKLPLVFFSQTKSRGFPGSAGASAGSGASRFFLDEIDRLPGLCRRLRPVRSLLPFFPIVGVFLYPLPQLHLLAVLLYGGLKKIRTQNYEGTKKKRARREPPARDVRGTSSYAVVKTKQKLMF